MSAPTASKIHGRVGRWVHSTTGFLRSSMALTERLTSAKRVSSDSRSSISRNVLMAWANGSIVWVQRTAGLLMTRRTP